MPNERRYSEDEIAAIFEHAADVQASARGGSSTDGLTLAEIQAIGAEAGLDPSYIAQAAAVHDPDLAGTPPPHSLGVQTGVAHSVLLPRPLTDPEWEQLVTRFRATFEASGKVEREGSLRTWSNGHLRIHAEPTEDGGSRLRFASRNAGKQSGLVGGAVNIAAGLVLFVIFSLFQPQEPVFAIFMLQALLGALLFGNAVVQLRPWRALRMEQFSRLGAHAIGLTGGSGTPTQQDVQVSALHPALSLDTLPDETDLEEKRGTTTTKGRTY